MALLTNLKTYREKYNLKQADLAELVGVRRETIVNLERGKYNPSLKLAMDIARVFHTTVEELFQYTDEYGSSSIYSKEDMDAAIKAIKTVFKDFDGCELHSISYSSDDQCNTPDHIAWMNELEAANDNKETFDQCIMFTSDFHSPKNGGGAWNPDEEYTGWQWWLARSNGGKWKLMTWGY